MPIPFCLVLTIVCILNYQLIHTLYLDQSFFGSQTMSNSLQSNLGRLVTFSEIYTKCARIKWGISLKSNKCLWIHYTCLILQMACTSDCFQAQWFSNSYFCVDCFVGVWLLALVAFVDDNGGTDEELALLGFWSKHKCWLYTITLEGEAKLETNFLS